MCKLFAYGPGDAIAIPKPHNLLPYLNLDWFYLSGTSLTQVVLEKRPLNGCSSSSSSSRPMPDVAALMMLIMVLIMVVMNDTDDGNRCCTYCRCSHFESLGSPLRSIHLYSTVASQVSRYLDQVVRFDT